MNYRKFLFLTCLSLINLAPTRAQMVFENKDIMALIDLVDFKNRTQPENIKYDGSPYLKDEFVSGIIFYDQKYRFEGIPLRYNIFNDEIEYKLPGKETIYAISSYQPVDKVIIAGDTFVARNFFHNDVIIPKFFKILVSGEVSLLLKMEVDYIPEQAATAFLDARLAEFVRRPDDYFIIRHNNKPEKIQNLKKLIRSLEKHEDELLQFKKAEKISPRNEEELILFIEYFNSLSSGG